MRSEIPGGGGGGGGGGSNGYNRHGEFYGIQSTGRTTGAGADAG